MATDLTYAYAADITKSERDEHGNLMVYGVATDPTMDLDDQIADPAWLKEAMPDWQRWGNLREMHQPIVAGIGKSLEEGEDGKWFLKSEVLDAGTAKKIEAGALKGYSIGIKNARVVKDKAAPGGRIVGGTIVEVSYVDRPCNPTATLMVAKAVGAESAAMSAVERPTPALMARMLGKTAADDLAKCNSGAGTDDTQDSARGGRANSKEDEDAELEKPRKTSGDPKPKKKGKKVRDLTNTNADGTAKAAQPIVGDNDADDATTDYDAKARKAKRKAKKAMKAAAIAELVARIDGLEKRVTASGSVVDSSGKDRSGTADEDFAGPGKTFPIDSRDDVSDAASLAHHAADPAAVRAKIRAIARRKFGMKGSEMPPSLRSSKVAKSDKTAKADLIKAAVDEQTAALRAELATLKATPMPGGPVVVKTMMTTDLAEEREAAAASVAKYRTLAKAASDRELAAGYEALAKKAESDLSK